MRWFDDEEKLFKKNSDLIKSALEKISPGGQADAAYYKTISEIYELENS